MRTRPTSVVAFWIAFSAVFALAVVAPACSNQGQGEVCDVNAGNGGNDDCQDGLTCQAAPGARTSANAYRCCPQDLSLATAQVCMLSTSPVDASSAPPAADASGDAEPSSDGAPEGSVGPEAGLEAAAPAAPDAGPDAIDDGHAE